MAEDKGSRIARRIAEFQERALSERAFCEELFRDATVRLLAHKYIYYVESKQFVDDVAYDCEEETWFVMGRALGLLTEDETSPCVDFDEKHPLAKEGIRLARRLKPR